jgi:hypothetical protein
MGFNLTIGELSFYIDEEGEKRSTVNEVEHKDAPRDGVPTDGTNKRWPSYTGWGSFCDYIGIEDDYFIPEHPGYKKIDAEFKSKVDNAYKRLYGKNPDQDVRLAWLKYWTDWAIENCKNPVLHNE